MSHASKPLAGLLFCLRRLFLLSFKTCEGEPGFVGNPEKTKLIELLGRDLLVIIDKIKEIDILTFSDGLRV